MQSKTEKERRASEFTKSRAALLIASAALALSTEITFAGNPTCELQARTEVYEAFLVAARRYRIAQDDLMGT
jgi:hypothetical protein